MALEQPMLRDPSTTPKMRSPNNNNVKEINQSPTKPNSPPNIKNNLCHRSESYRTLEMGVPDGDSGDEKKLAWLWSDIIGDGVEFDSPFGSRRLTYADHTASGRSLHYIENFIISNVLPFYGNSHTCDSYVGHRTTKMVHEASQYIKRCLGGGQDDAILFCGSGTTGAIKRLQEVMGIAIAPTLRDRALQCLSQQERWIVFVGPYEHHSNLLSWRQSLAEVIEIGLDDDSLIDIDALRQKLKSFRNANRPILGSFSACSNVTGIYTDTRKIAKLLHKYGGFACFDFAASGPYMEIDMKSGKVDGYDAVFLSPHKFLGGPGTPGILLMSKSLYQLRSSPPSTCGGGTVNYVNGFNEMDTLYRDEIEERENAGTPQIIQTIRAALAFWVKEYIGYEVIMKQEDIYTQKALKRLTANKHLWVLGNTTAKRQAILSFLVYSTSDSCLPDVKNGRSNIDSKEYKGSLYMWAQTGNKRDKPLHGPFVAVLLNDIFGVQARGGCACAGPYGHLLLGIDNDSSLAFRSAIEKGYCGLKPGWTRISFPYYMSIEEFEFTLAAIEFVAIYGQRFLPLYQLNLETGSWTFKKKALQDLMGKENNGDVSPSPSTFPDAIQAINIKNRKMEYNNTEAKHVEMINKFTSYLEVGKKIARKLPKFPCPRSLPDSIDPNLLHFRL